MALAIRRDQLIFDGEVTDQAELARLGHVTRARLTQIMNLLCLAPDLQEQILFLPVTERGRDAVAAQASKGYGSGGKPSSCKKPLCFSVASRIASSMLTRSS